MGISYSSQKQIDYIEKKRQNHPIFGQSLLIQHPSSRKFFTQKHIRVQNHNFVNRIQKLAAKIQCNTNLAHQDLTNQKYYLQVFSIKNQSSLVATCHSQQHQYTIIFDSIQVDLQTIQDSKKFVKFSEKDLINILYSVLEGIIVLNGMKIGIVPISKKSVIMGGFQEQYNGEDISQVKFKVIPIDFVLQKSWHIDSILTYEQYQNYSKQESPKSHIYNLGKLILQLLRDTYSKDDKIKRYSKHQFLSSSSSYRSHFNINQLEQGMKTLSNSQYSTQFKQMIRQMLLPDQDQRIGLTCLYQLLKELKYAQLNSTKRTYKVQLIQRSYKNRNVQTMKNSPKKRMSGMTKYCSNQVLGFSLDLTSRGRASNEQNSKKVLNEISSKILNERSNISLQKLQKTFKPGIQNRQTQGKQAISLKLVSLNQNSVPDERREEKLIENSKDQDRKMKIVKKKVNFSSGAFYQGQLDSNSNFHGFGTLYYDSKQTCYTGHWKNNKFDGFGYLFNKNYHKNSAPTNFFVNYRNFSFSIQQGGQSLSSEHFWSHYEGEFKEDVKEGYGVLYFFDGSRFEGQFRNGKACGAGTFKIKSEKKVHGVWQNNNLIFQYL